jgi:hypothetical protein
MKPETCSEGSVSGCQRSTAQVRVTSRWKKETELFSLSGKLCSSPHGIFFSFRRQCRRVSSSYGLLTDSTYKKPTEAQMTGKPRDSEDGNIDDGETQ